MDQEYSRDLLLRMREELVATLEPIRVRLRQSQRDSSDTEMRDWMLRP